MTENNAQGDQTDDQGQIDSEAVKAYEQVGEDGVEQAEGQGEEGAESSGSAVEAANDALVEELQQKLDEHRDALLRTRAEMDNLQKRAARDVEHARKFGLEKFLEKLIPVKDSLEAGADMASQENAEPERLLEGMNLTLKMLEKLMEENNVEVLNPVGEVFDPQFHEAMTTQPSEEHKPDTVLQVFQRGYVLNGRLIRPARVIVAAPVS
jgi:molecular chaperone GrpE